MNTKIDSYCGIICSECEFREKCNCDGCIANRGDMFYGQCQVAKCAISKNKRFCGECEEFPCDTLTKYSYDKEHGDNGKRIENCKKLKANLVAQARKGIDPISVCGHHCDFCFMAQWCGGCRSNYNCCSFATLYDDGVCPNVKCAKEKNLEGCYMCDELKTCTKGYYKQENEYVAKATALFIKKYGKATYSSTLKKAIDNGVNYPKTFDESGSVEKSIAILEKYL